MRIQDDTIIKAAQSLKNDLAFKATMDYLKSVYTEELFATAPDNKEAREMLYHRVTALNDIQATLGMIAKQADKKG